MFFAYSLSKNQTYLTVGKSLCSNNCLVNTLSWHTTDEYKLIDFYGINTNGSVKEECSGFVDKDANGYYSINIPSTHRGNKVTTLGNKLFMGVDIDTFEP